MIIGLLSLEGWGLGHVCLAEVEHFGVQVPTESMRWGHGFSTVGTSCDSGTLAISSAKLEAWLPLFSVTVLLLEPNNGRKVWVAARLYCMIRVTGTSRGRYECG